MNKKAVRGSWFELRFRGKKKAPNVSIGAYRHKMVEDYPRNSKGVSKLKMSFRRNTLIGIVSS